MLTQGLKRNVCWVVIVAMALIVLGNIGTCEAARRTLDLQQKMIRQRQVEINGKLYNVIVNHTDSTMTIRGYVDDWDEMDKVEKYFRLRVPNNYQVISELDFGY